MRRFTLLFTLAIFSSSTWADCVFKDGTTTGYFFLSIPALRPPKNPAPDTVLWDSGIINPTPTPHITCLTEQVVYSGYLTSKNQITSVATPYVYETNIPGIGIQIITSHDKVNSIYMKWPRNTEQAHANYKYNQENYFHVTLVATGKPLASGTLELSGYDVDRTFGSASQYILEFNPAKIIVQATGCDLETKDINIVLTGNKGLIITDFPNISSTSTPINFNINLNCEITTSVNITFNGKTIGGQQTILSLDNNSELYSAQGLGVQILNNGQPINFQEQKEVIESVTTPKVSLPYQARLIRFNETLRAGEINATATFDIIYH